MENIRDSWATGSSPAVDPPNLSRHGSHLLFTLPAWDTSTHLSELDLRAPSSMQPSLISPGGNACPTPLPHLFISVPISPLPFPPQGQGLFPLQLCVSNLLGYYQEESHWSICIFKWVPVMKWIAESSGVNQIQEGKSFTGELTLESTGEGKKTPFPLSF